MYSTIYSIVQMWYRAVCNTFSLPFGSRFLDKMYVLSSQEALQTFMQNPRPYLLPPMPRPPCRVAVIGPPCSGKSTLSASLAKRYGAVLIDLKILMEPLVAKFRQERLEEARQHATVVALEKVKAEMDTMLDSGENCIEGLKNSEGNYGIGC